MKRFLSIFLSCLLLCSPVYAHSGRTDSSGGHRDNKNASGLGSYHYHCGGYSAHLHPNGVCPYAKSSAPSTPSVSSASKPQTPVQTPVPEPILPPIVLIINGIAVSTDAPPVIVNDRTLVPVRAILDAMGATIGWSDESKQVTAELGDTTIILSIGNTTAIVNNQFEPLDVPAQIINGRTMIPARFVAENLNADVTWDETTRTVTIFSQPIAPVVRDFDTKTDQYGNVYKGKTIDGEFVGEVSVYLPDGRLAYQGELNENMEPHGHGRIIYDSGYTEGTFENFRLQGTGYRHFENGHWMKVEFIDDKVIDGTYYVYLEVDNSCIGEVTFKNGEISKINMYYEDSAEPSLPSYEEPAYTPSTSVNTSDANQEAKETAMRQLYVDYMLAQKNIRGLLYVGYEEKESMLQDLDARYERDKQALEAYYG